MTTLASTVRQKQVQQQQQLRKPPYRRTTSLLSWSGINIPALLRTGVTVVSLVLVVSYVTLFVWWIHGGGGAGGGEDGFGVWQQKEHLTQPAWVKRMPQEAPAKADRTEMYHILHHQDLKSPTIQRLDTRFVFNPLWKQLEGEHNDELPDYGDLIYRSISNLVVEGDHHDNATTTTTTWARFISRSDLRIYSRTRNNFLKEMDKMDSKLAKRIFSRDEELQDDPPNGCHRNPWKSMAYSICNTFHEFPDLVEGFLDPHHEGLQVAFRGAGFFRDAWEWSHQGVMPTSSATTTTTTITNRWVMKRIHLDDTLNYGIRNIATIAQEAIIMERLSASPRIVDIYGYCGTSMLVEPMVGEIDTEINADLERQEVRELFQPKRPRHNHNDKKSHHEPSKMNMFPLNNLTNSEKLILSLEMAESLADLHGFRDGIIVHGDVHPVQWLRTADGTVKLNDFNNAMILDWNYKASTYCKEFSNFPGGFHSPEENMGLWVIDDRIDVWALGQTMYTILTGLYPYWEIRSSQIQSVIINGTWPILDDSRYRVPGTVESKLVEVIEQCWTLDPEMRPTIFEIIRLLRNITL
jgi:hypothetical protein